MSKCRRKNEVVFKQPHAGDTFSRSGVRLMSSEQRVCPLSDSGRHKMERRGYGAGQALRCNACGVRESELLAAATNKAYSAATSLTCEIHGTGDPVPDEASYFEPRFDTSNQIAGNNSWIHLLKPGATTNLRGTIQTACGPRTYTCYVIKIDSCEAEIEHITCPRCSLLAKRAIKDLKGRCRELDIDLDTTSAATP